MTDFRSDRMPSADGLGFARRAWNAYRKGVDKAFGPLASDIAASKVDGLVGFWVLWHMYGGFDGLRELGFPRTTIFRKVAAFRRTFGYHPDVFVFDGVHVEAGVTSASLRQADGSTVSLADVPATE